MTRTHRSAQRAPIALVICNGEPPSRHVARRLAGRADLVVAADGGGNLARRYGILPDFIIGDLDSISPATRRFFLELSGHKGIRSRKRPHRTQVIQNAGQDNTDLEKALDFLLMRKAAGAIIVGVTGKRADFTFGNISVLWNYADLMHITVVGDGWYAIPMSGRKSFSAPVGTTVSLIPFGPCRGITLKGLVFPLTDASMKVGEVGLSNVVSRTPFTVTVRKGRMLVFIMARHDLTLPR